MAPSLPKSKASSSSAAIQKVTQLEQTLLSDPSDPNPLLELTTLSRHSAPEVVHKAIWALHRVFIAFIEQGRVGGLVGTDSNGSGGTGSEGKEGDEVREVKAWVRERLIEYVEVLGGLMRDSEASLRSSAPPLLFSLLPPLSTSSSPLPNPQIIHTPYLRLIIRHLLHPTPSLRGSTPSLKSSSKWTTTTSNQVDLPTGVLPNDVAKLVVDEYWAKYDDLRWGFFKEAEHFLKNNTLSHPENLLNLLIPLTNLPKLPEDLNTFFLPSLSSPPSASAKLKSKTKKPVAKKPKLGKIKGENDATPSWMEYYDSDSSVSSVEDLSIGKRKSQPSSTQGIRTSSLSVHASIHSLPSHITLYTKLWESVLSLAKLDEGMTRRILVGLHGKKGILEGMRSERRVRVADWLGGLVDGGGGNGMLAMNGLFVLMTQYNLDYPNFYTRLYGLLDRNVLHVKYRARFFRLLDTFLSSTLLPAALVASFIKRLSRLALSAPPAGIIMLIPFIYNLFKRHPGCMVMIQRHGEDAPETDPYLPTATNPLTTHAIESSCWELSSLQSHYLASVSTLAKIFTEVFTKPEYNLEDFLDHGYGSLFETEATRKIKNPPSLAIDLELPTSTTTAYFPRKDVEEEVRASADLVGQLWAF